MKCAACGHLLSGSKHGRFPVFERVGMVLRPVPYAFACRNCSRSGVVVVCTQNAGVRG